MRRSLMEVQGDVSLFWWLIGHLTDCADARQCVMSKAEIGDVAIITHGAHSAEVSVPRHITRYLGGMGTMFGCAAANPGIVTVGEDGLSCTWQCGIMTVMMAIYGHEIVGPYLRRLVQIGITCSADEVCRDGIPGGDADGQPRMQSAA